MFRSLLYCNVNFITLNQINKWCICWWVKYVDFKMHGATVKIVKRERKPTRCNNQMFIINTFSTCFGHHYARLQENKDRVLLHMVCCAVTTGEKVDISCDVFFVGYCVVNLVRNSCLYANVVCKWVCGSVGLVSAPAPHTPPIKQAQHMHQYTRSRYTRPGKRTILIPVQHHDTPICTPHSHIHTRSHLGLQHNTPQKRHHS